MAINETQEEDKSESTVPVPVDDDTNDPQYIPRRGRFYEHDDRMAYSTTSSEESVSNEVHDEASKNGDGKNSLYAIIAICISFCVFLFI